ncbi:unnamed protein product [Cuscuta epithymum]|uniref:Gag1-like clamp domain-containing protein n=1 Tax=Cuscuta epithymum TaxID=186058 RepID=A0AAV0CUH5_9ASTE|nr:unnamed protein product [Cuscuta epithymum]
MMLYSSLCAWINQFLACMGGCFGCCGKSRPITAVDEPSKGLRIQGRLVKRRNSISEDFWSSSTIEMENSTAQSQRSLSSISISNPLNPTNDQSCGSGNTSHHPEFVNHGYLLWNQTRLQWLRSKEPDTKRKVLEPVLNWNATYESLLGTNKCFPRPIPLAEMVDFLVDVWEQEGLYD